tara:strand:+ start:51 stop:500 length:450 start_codon:yes stop_codon:yes gene_type:complete
MNFLQSTIDLSGEIPVRGYIHRVGIEVYGNTKAERRGSAVCNLRNIKNSDKFLKIVKEEELDYLLAALWADGQEKVIDLFGFGDVRNNWPSNPDVLSWSFRKGVLRRGALTCGDMLLVLGEEERYRRTTPNLKHYLGNPPKIEGIDQSQ